jgi:hypothetical protein
LNLYIILESINRIETSSAYGISEYPLVFDSLQIILGNLVIVNFNFFVLAIVMYSEAFLDVIAQFVHSVA